MAKNDNPWSRFAAPGSNDGGASTKSEAAKPKYTLPDVAPRDRGIPDMAVEAAPLKRRQPANVPAGGVALSPLEEGRMRSGKAAAPDVDASQFGDRVEMPDPDALTQRPAAPRPQTMSRKERRQAKRAARGNRRGGASKAAGGAPRDPDDGFHVPPVGRGLRGERGMSAAARVLIGSSLLVAALGGTGIGAMLLGGSLARANEGAITSKQASQWHIDQFNTDAAAAFGARYVTQCLARSGDATTDQARKAAVDTANATTSDPACGVGNGREGSRTVTSVVFSGDSQPVPGEDRARYLSFDTSLSDGRGVRVAVPVFLEDPTLGIGPRVNGSIGLMPLPALGQPSPRTSAPENIDTALSTQLTTEFLPDFMVAWAGSTPSLQQYLTSDATAAARTGLYGYFGEPTIGQVIAYAPDTATKESSGSYTYHDGDVVEADVKVAFSAVGNYAPSAGSYRVSLIRNGSHWFIRDVVGGTIGQTQSQTKPTQTAMPTPTPTVATKK